MADAEALFRNHAILIIWPNPNLPWDDDAAERILEERPSARVPVHGEETLVCDR
jgi:hypothetical protein